MKTKILLLWLLATSVLCVQAQTIFRGVVIDAQSRQPIANAKIGITNQGVGVLSDNQGNYTYKKYEQTLSDTDKLFVSATGYESIELGARAVRALFNKNNTIQLESVVQTDQVPQIKDVIVFWDISEGMQERDLEKELAIVQQYIGNLGAVSVTLQTFNSKIVDTEIWKKWDGDMVRFRETVTKNTYNGPSNYSALIFDETDAMILVSNGEPNYGKLSVSQEKPIYAVSHTATREGAKHLERLARYTSGKVLRFTEEHYTFDTVEKAATIQKKQEVSGTKLRGTITSLGKPVQGASILKKGSFAEYITDSKGYFEIPAQEGEVLKVSALGMFSKEINIGEKSTMVIELIPNSDQLDEVEITGKTERIIVNDKEIDGLKVPYVPGGVTALGDFYITSKDITPSAQTVEQVIRNKFKNVWLSNGPYGQKLTIGNGGEPTYYIDGVKWIAEHVAPFYIPDNEIESIVVKTSAVGTTRYGPYIEGLAVIITTRSSSMAKAKRISSVLAKNNDYTEEAKDISENAQLITGVITGPQGPIQGAEVLRKGSFDIVQTKADGSFELRAQSGDILFVSALGMFSKEIPVTLKNNYSIALVPNEDLLDEVVVQGKQGQLEQTKSQEIFKYGPDFETDRYKLQGFGSFNVTTITKNDFNFEMQPDMERALFGRFESVFVYRDPSKPNYGRPYILRGAFEEPIQLFIDGQLSLGTVHEVNPSEVNSISIKSDKTGIMQPALFIDTNRYSISRKKESPLVTGNDYTEEPRDDSKTIQKITGTITSPNGALTEASITKKGSFNEVTTNGNGEFSIKATIGDILFISAQGMFPKELLIESQDMGTIQLTPKSNDLEAIVLDGQERVDNTVETADGKINADKLGYTAQTVDYESNFASGATTLQQLITGKVPGVDVAGGLYSGSQVVYKIRGGTQSINTEQPPIWIVNGTPYQDPPDFLDVQQIKSITVLKSVMATSRYGSLAAGGAFLIKTKEADFKNKAAASNKSALVSGNEYTGDVTGNVETAIPSYILRFRESGTPQQQLALYKKLSRTQESPLEYYVDAAQYFQSLSPALGDEVRSDLSYIARNNTKALRTLAYLYELENDTENVVLVNERIAKIAPQEAQSYRDLALAYQNNRQYDKALELYVNMLGEQILGVNFDGLEKPLRSELSRLVALHKDKIDFKRLPNEWLRTDFKRDMRMVIEWSDRSVPFEFQFVNPDKKFFKWTHTLEEIRERLQAEQKHGFQTEEFIIDDAPAGEWIINIQYLGDEGDYVLPPFLKYTVFRNYGTTKETKEVRVIKLFKQVEKVTLGRLVM